MFSGDAGFEETTFSGDAQFKRAIFYGDAWFEKAIFSGETCFEEANFSDLALFSLATFAGATVFDSVTFSGATDFKAAAFSGDAQFKRAVFANTISFHRVLFSEKSWFEGATFSRGVWFEEAAFAGATVFDSATFSEDAWFERATFSSDARFEEVSFSKGAQFESVTFSGDAWFEMATFSDLAWFDQVTFSGVAQFREATFYKVTRFNEVRFLGDAEFSKAIFSGLGNIWFNRAIFSRDADFLLAQFEAAGDLGPFVCGGIVHLQEALFVGPVTVEIAARGVLLERVRWQSTAALRLRYAWVDLTEAVLEAPVTLAVEPAAFSEGVMGLAAKVVLAGRSNGVRINTISGVDAAHLSLTDVDLSDCTFAGAVHIDQLRLEGRITFDRPPAGWHLHGLVPLRWSRRRTLAEEHHWRAAAAGRPRADEQATERQWWPGKYHPDPERTPSPAMVAALYRQLRKALEDGKNEPGAADFYYGECEMRRHDRGPDSSTTRSERLLLTAYWAISGYGLRASRALAWLGVTMTATVLALMMWGIPADTPKQTTTGHQVQVGQNLTLTTDTPDPANPTGTASQRLTAERSEKALRVVINSTVFRSSGQDLTTAGTYTEMASRVTEPVLLGLGVLAIRARVKR
ncbi:pentapeptide repeat-containing protein [Streptomyces sp. B1866]|uniref:pentapeptide repeat-containing protein n=1 Tax=Streptomyces sp. B1866 TaxID=3075431 RepID=UPI00288F36D5|nr:pentapeptide repeat-containing protein [Streptomyces sp. B1866]MDT3395249.1 pentapeptide repeat-containing protein [Streptomyces sp. B1866]